jgi:hypothetical protein
MPMELKRIRTFCWSNVITECKKKRHCYNISFPLDCDSCTEPLGFWRLIWTYSISVFTYCLGNPGYKIDEKHGDRVKMT